MDTTKPATGIQIAIVIALFVFATSIVGYYLEPAIGWPPEHSKVISNALAFSLALVLFITIAPLRRYVNSELSIPIPIGYRIEVVGVGIAKIAIPFAVMGALFLYYSAGATGATDLYSQLGLVKRPDLVDQRYYSTIGLLYAVVISTLVGPVVEEIAFRGFLYGAWERQWGWIRGMLATSLCFALLHYNGRMMLTFLGSIVFVCLLRRTGTLWAPIVAHMAYNGLTTWPLLCHVVMLKPREGIERFESWVAELACLAFVVTALPTYIWLARTKRSHDIP